MGPRHHRDDRVHALLAAQIERWFPTLRGLRVSHAYGGCVAMTRDFVPHVGRIGGGVHFAHGYCGNGIATTHTAGKVLRDLVLARDTTYSNLLLVRDRELRFPAEP